MNSPITGTGNVRVLRALLPSYCIAVLWLVFDMQAARAQQTVDWRTQPRVSLSITLTGPNQSNAMAEVSTGDGVLESKPLPGVLRFSLTPQFTKPNSTATIEIRARGARPLDIKYILQIVGGKVAIGPAPSTCEAPTVSLSGDSATNLRLAVPTNNVRCRDHEIAAPAQSLGGILLVRPKPDSATVRLNGALMDGNGEMALLLPWDRESTIAFEAFGYATCVRKVQLIKFAPYMVLDGHQTAYRDSKERSRMSVVNCNLNRNSK